MDKLPELERLSEPEKDALMAALWAEVQRLKGRLAALEAKQHAPRQDAHHASVPPSPTPTANLSTSPRPGRRREARVGRAGGGRPLHPDPDHVISAQAKTCPPCGGAVQAHEQHPHAGYDKIALPPVKPIVTRVEQHGGQWPHGGPPDGVPVPVGMEPGTPFGASIQSLATSLRYPHALSDQRRSALCAHVWGVPSSEGALATRFRRVKTRLAHRVEEILTRLRSRRLLCRDETGARVHGRTPWEGVFPKAAVGGQVIRPSRGQGVIHEVLGDHRPSVWGSDLYRAQKTHPAEPWPVCVAHQGREGQFALEAGDTVFAPRMKAVRLRAVAIHQRRDT